MSFVIISIILGKLFNRLLIHAAEKKCDFGGKGAEVIKNNDIKSPRSSFGACSGKQKLLQKKKLIFSFFYLAPVSKQKLLLI